MASGSRDTFSPTPLAEVSIEELKANSCCICGGRLVPDDNASPDEFVKNPVITRLHCSHHCHTYCRTCDCWIHDLFSCISDPLCVVYCMEDESSSRRMWLNRHIMFCVVATIIIVLSHMFRAIMET